MTDEGALSFSYSFSAAETMALARFLRASSETLPRELFPFAHKVEATVYGAMSISDARAFYS